MKQTIYKIMADEPRRPQKESVWGVSWTVKEAWRDEKISKMINNLICDISSSRLGVTNNAWSVTLD